MTLEHILRWAGLVAEFGPPLVVLLRWFLRRCGGER
jgi:hypothetical protein